MGDLWINLFAFHLLQGWLSCLFLSFLSPFPVCGYWMSPRCPCSMPHLESQMLRLAQHPQMLFGKVHPCPVFSLKACWYPRMKQQGKWVPRIQRARKFASQQNTPTSSPVYVCATYRQHNRHSILSIWTGRSYLEENVQKYVFVFMKYLICYTVSTCTSALNSKTAWESVEFIYTMKLMSAVYVYLSVPPPFRNKM